VEQDEFSPEEKFSFLETYTDYILDGEMPGLLVSGDPGIGKTHRIMQRLDARGLKDSIDFLEESVSEGRNISEYGDYVVIKGFSTAKYMYRKFYEYRNKIIIYDDCDKVLKDEVARNILKAALDSYPKRVVTWGAERFKTGEEDDLPNTFVFTGRVIAITNIPEIKIDEAVRSRCETIDFVLTAKQKMDLITHVVENGGYAKFPEVVRMEALEYLQENYRYGDPSRINFRTFERILRHRRLHPNWIRLSDSAIGKRRRHHTAVA
jgi:hypothetical protein